MRFLSRLLAFALGIGLLSVPDPGQTQGWTPGWFTCGALRPMSDDRNIRMELMRVVVRLDHGLVTFDSEFRMVNPGPTIAIGVCYPDWGRKGDEDIWGFTAWVNGMRADVIKQECDNEAITISDGYMWVYVGEPPMTNCGFAHKVTFAGHSITTIRTRYSSRGPAEYLLGPATYWKGPITKTVIIVDSSDVGGTRRIKRLKEPVPRQQLLGDNLLKYEFGPSEPWPDCKLLIYP